MSVHTDTRVGAGRTKLRKPLLVLLGFTLPLAILGRTSLMPSSVGYTCPFKAVTGYNCPGCGLSRCVHALAHGDILGAMHFNLLFVAMLPVLAWAWFRWFRAEQTGRPLHGPSRTVTALLLVAVVGFSVLRNVPHMPLIWLH